MPVPNLQPLPWQLPTALQSITSLFVQILARPIAALQSDEPESRAVAYADDVLLMAAPDRAHVLLNTRQDLIARMGLKINATKLVVRNPGSGRILKP